MSIISDNSKFTLPSKIPQWIWANLSSSLWCHSGIVFVRLHGDVKGHLDLVIFYRKRGIKRKKKNYHCQKYFVKKKSDVRFDGFCWQKKASDPCDVVISSFEATEIPLFSFFALFSVKQLIVPCVLNSSLCVLYLYFCTCVWLWRCNDGSSVLVRD